MEKEWRYIYVRGESISATGFEYTKSSSILENGFFGEQTLVKSSTGSQGIFRGMFVIRYLLVSPPSLSHFERIGFI
ncbi:MAG: hypothetical protein WC379_11225 [Methanoregula sp.]